MTLTAEPPRLGYRRNQHGIDVAEQHISERDRLADDLVLDLTVEAERLNAQLAAFKLRAFGDIAAFVALSLETYGVPVGGAKGNVSIVSYDGRRRIEIRTAAEIAVDERIAAAQQLVEECLAAWTSDAEPHLRELVQLAFRPTATGGLSVAKLITLRRLRIEDERWQRAMRALDDALIEVSRTSYVRVFVREGEDATNPAWRPVPLSIAAV
ncbi:DUF3164 family protein [Plasticicumulans sp.]|uniref:DUF3164 family protein n=1 Tax=Plasticicumulans sp. TaxID=2307179 RepID=UPI0032201295